MAHLHFMGIGGQGISAAAQMAHLAGETVTGCDRQMSATVKAMREAGIPVQLGHSAEHLADVDTLVISPAVPALDPQNPELLAARERGIRVATWQELFGELIQDKYVLSVSGVHGKSTTTSMLSLVLTDAGFDPTCLIGAVVPQLNANYRLLQYPQSGSKKEGVVTSSAPIQQMETVYTHNSNTSIGTASGANYRLGNSQYVVNEADEFNHNFWHYHPRLAIIKSIEYEHPEFFADYEAFLGAFEHFIWGMDMSERWPLPPTLLLNADNAGCDDLRARLGDWPGRLLTFSLKGEGQQSEPAAFEAYDIRLDGETSFRVRARIGVAFPEEPIHLRIPGLHNVENALSALAAAHCVGVPAASIVRTLESFSGTRRRFDIRNPGPFTFAGEARDVMLVDDYAHHPTAIAATLAAARRRYPERRLVAVYQPHMYSRTKTFFDQFLSAFDDADVVVIADIFPARERDTGLIHARDLVEAMRQRPHFIQGKAKLYHGGNIEQLARLLTSILGSGDLALIMGAGDIYTVTDQLLQNAEAV